MGAAIYPIEGRTGLKSAEFITAVDTTIMPAVAKYRWVKSAVSLKNITMVPAAYFRNLFAARLLDIKTWELHSS